MFTGLVSYIDRLYLAHYQKKLQDVKDDLGDAVTVRDNLAVARKRLIEIKYPQSGYNAVYCNKTWVTLDQVDRMYNAADQLVARLTRDEYEKYGTACATLKRRIATRDAKIAGHQLSGSSFV